MTKDEIRQSESMMREAIEAAGGTLTRGRMALCFHGEKNESAGYYWSDAWLYKCHACGFGGDYFDLMALATGVSVEDQLRALRSGGAAAGAKVVTRRPRLQKTEPEPKYSGPRCGWVAVLDWSRRDGVQSHIDGLADVLGVSVRAVRAAHVGWLFQGEIEKLKTSAESGAWSIPMVDALGNVIGIHLRPQSGKKKCITGSSLGSIIPEPFQVFDADWLIITEGESDCMTALDWGFRAIARPGCDHARQITLDYVDRINPARIAIFADADDAGQRGAHKLAAMIVERGRGCSVLTAPDGHKDLRKWKAGGATTHDLMALLDSPTRRAA